MKKFTAGLLIATLCASFSANAERPSFTSLQQQTNQLQAQVNQLANQTRVVRDGNGVTFGKVIANSAYEAEVIYQWQGYDLLLIFESQSPPNVSPSGYRLGDEDFFHTETDCSDEPWFFADRFNQYVSNTITGDRAQNVAYVRDPDSNTFKIIRPANPGQPPVTITVVARSHAQFPGVCIQDGPDEFPNMTQGFVKLAPVFGDDHPLPYTVVVE